MTSFKVVTPHRVTRYKLPQKLNKTNVKCYDITLSSPHAPFNIWQTNDTLVPFYRWQNHSQKPLQGVDLPQIKSWIQPALIMAIVRMRRYRDTKYDRAQLRPPQFTIKKVEQQHKLFLSSKQLEMLLSLLT